MRERYSRQSKQPVCRIWPDGTFGLGYAYAREETPPASENLAGGVSLSAMRDAAREVRARAGSPLDLTSPPNSHKQGKRPETYGRKGITSWGKKMVCNGAHLLQQRYPAKHLTFLTLTVPPLPKEAQLALGRGWGNLVRQLIQWLVRRLRRARLDTSVVLAVECQSERSKSGDVGCLHIHAIYQGRRARKTWGIPTEDIRAWWLEALSRVSGVPVASGNCVDTKPVKGRASRYLSKYISKGGEGAAYLGAVNGWECVPRQWWGMSAAARRWVKSMVMSSAAIAQILDDMVYMHWAEGVPGFRFLRPIEVETTEYQSRIVGWFGCLRGEAYSDLWDLSRAVG